MTIHDDVDDVLFAGDWHGNLYQAEAAVLAAAARGIKVIVQAGDFGLWTPKQETFRFLKGLNNVLVQHDIVLYWVDGNHECFPHLYEWPIGDDGTRQIRTNIFHLPRGLRWEWLGVKFVALGGAHSVDKDYRVHGEEWWPEEHVTYAEIQQVIDGGPADVMIMHDVPAGVPNLITDDPLGQHQAARWFGEHNIGAATMHRAILAQAYEVVNPGLIVHGHYHKRYTRKFVTPQGRNGTVICLDEGAHGIAYNTLAMTLAEIQVLVNE